MGIAPEVMDSLLAELCRFLIEAADVARETAPARTPEVAAYEVACANAAIDSLRAAITTRNREPARDPLRDMAARLGLTLDEDDADWARLAFRALRVMLDAQQENLRRDQGQFDGPSPAFRSARRCIDTPATTDIQPAMRPAMPVPTPTAAPSGHGIAREKTAEIGTGGCTLPPESPEVGKPIAESPDPRSDATGVSCAKDRTTQAEDRAAASACPSISTTAATYIDLRSQGYTRFTQTEQSDQKAGASWARNSAYNVRGTARLMTRILGDKPFDAITDADLKHMWELYARLPRSYQAKTSRLSPQEAADEADAAEKRNRETVRARLATEGASPGKIDSELLKTRIPRLTPATIYRHMQDVQRITVMMMAKGHISVNIMKEHIWDAAEYERRATLQEDNERLTWTGHLDRLFRSPIFQDKLDDVGDPMFWAPLIALLMGLRSEEILQLNTDDIQILDDVPCIVLRQGPGQSLKSCAARRTVPIHDNLLTLGFMKLVAQRRREDEPRLFPWIERSESKKTFTETFSKRFTRYRRDHGIYHKQRDFHSLRTTFNHLLIESECPDTQRRALMGHVERDVGITNYNPHGFSRKLLLRRVNAIKLDISAIRAPFGDQARTNVAQLSDRRPCSA